MRYITEQNQPILLLSYVVRFRNFLHTTWVRIHLLLAMQEPDTLVCTILSGGRYYGYRRSQNKKVVHYA